MVNMNLSGKIILLTGASSGIGNALIHEFLKQGARIALVARRIELIEKSIEGKNYNAGDFLIVKCDVSEKDEVAAAYKIIKEKFGHIDIAFLNAGIGHRMPVDEFNSGIAKKTFGANVFGVIYWIEQILPDFLKNRKGMIVGVSSQADNRGYSGSSFYSASKAALSIYFEGLRVELHPYNIKVITVRPGFVKTPMTDRNEFKMPFLMPADKAARIIVSGIKKEKRIIQFPLSMVLITKIVGNIPGRIYEYLAIKQQAKMEAIKKNSKSINDLAV
jgi:short-subunit dehydrogenase